MFDSSIDSNDELSITWVLLQLMLAQPIVVGNEFVDGGDLHLLRIHREAS